MESDPALGENETAIETHLSDSHAVAVSSTSKVTQWTIVILLRLLAMRSAASLDV
jgi:hypothetical protein